MCLFFLAICRLAGNCVHFGPDFSWMFPKVKGSGFLILFLKLRPHKLKKLDLCVLFALFVSHVVPPPPAFRRNKPRQLQMVARCRHSGSVLYAIWCESPPATARPLLKDLYTGPLGVGLQLVQNWSVHRFAPEKKIDPTACQKCLFGHFWDSFGQNLQKKSWNAFFPKSALSAENEWFPVMWTLGTCPSRGGGGPAAFEVPVQWTPAVPKPLTCSPLFLDDFLPLPPFFRRPDPSAPLRLSPASHIGSTPAGPRLKPEAGDLWMSSA